jgi:hypothetical protein
LPNPAWQGIICHKLVKASAPDKIRPQETRQKLDFSPPLPGRLKAGIWGWAGTKQSKSTMSMEQAKKRQTFLSRTAGLQAGVSGGKGNLTLEVQGH